MNLGWNGECDVFKESAKAPFCSGSHVTLATQSGPIPVVMEGGPSPWASGKTLAMNDWVLLLSPASLLIQVPQSHWRVVGSKTTDFTPLHDPLSLTLP